MQFDIPGNMQPAPGSPALIVASFAAPNLIENAKWTQANSLRNLLNSLQAVNFGVSDIVAVQTVPGGAPGAQTLPFSQLRNFGVTENDWLNLYLVFSANPSKKVNVGLTINQFRSAGTDNFGKPNYLKGFQDMLNVIALELGHDPITTDQLYGILFSIDQVRDMAYSQLLKYLS